MRRLLITSVGSFVGSAILTAIAPRRSEWYVTGINSTPHADGIFDCDVARLVPPVADAEAFQECVLEIVADERPALIVAGRDADLPMLAQLRDELAALGAYPLVGSEQAIAVCDDKYESAKVLRAAGLPFAESIAYPGEIERFLEHSDYPYIAKPRSGFSSRGLRVLFSRTEIDQAITTKHDTVVQQYIAPAGWTKRRNQMSRDDVFDGDALLQVDELSLQAFLDRDGKALGVCSARTAKRSGHVYEAQVLDDPFIDDAARRIAEHLGTKGLTGPVAGPSISCSTNLRNVSCGSKLACLTLLI